MSYSISYNVCYTTSDTKGFVIRWVNRNGKVIITFEKYILLKSNTKSTMPNYFTTMVIRHWFRSSYYHLFPLDETHLDTVRGLILPRGFHPAHQQVELVGAMRLCSTRTNRSAYAYTKDFIQSRRI